MTKKTENESTATEIAAQAAPAAQAAQVAPAVPAAQAVPAVPAVPAAQVAQAVPAVPAAPVTQLENELVNATETPAEPDPAAPQSLAALAAAHRIPGWQQAALLRLAGWADDKLVTDQDYRAALATLSGRRLGGGRV